VPVKTIVASAVPSPVVKVRPVMPRERQRAVGAVSVTLTRPRAGVDVADADQVSVAAEKTRLVSSLTLCAPARC
jgi:hypothetical protein